VIWQFRHTPLDRFLRFIMRDKRFGPYLVEVENEKHAVIRREDDQPVEPTFYEMQHIKCIAFGGPATAVEILPSSRDLIDGQNQRHLWKVERDSVPNLNFRDTT
jgi:hypothetical protein